MATILFSLAGSCIQKLQEIITEEAIQILGVKKDLRELQQTMKQIQYFLKDADRRSIEDTSASNWFGELRDAMYDADDIIDSARFKGSTLLGEHPSSSSSRKLTKCIGFPPFSCFSTIYTRHEIAVQIRGLNKRIQNSAELGRTFLKYEAECVGNITVSNIRKTSHLVEPNLVGKEIIYATNKLIDMVLKNRGKKTYKIGIVGTGGVGKTTLAQKLYSDSRVQGRFDKHAWICISQKYSDVAVLKEILQSIEVDHQGESMEQLQSKLAEAIKGKSFFLVLDDLWQSDVWTNLLRTPLHTAGHGTVVVTTRHETVAKEIVGMEHIHQVELMSEETGWELLLKTMDINDENEVYGLRDTGKEIVQKCGGLPLAIRVIASVLAAKERNEIEWRKILRNDAWSMNKLPAELRGALYLSYDQLPQNLKQCFLYCALYPEDWTMFRDDLVRFWVAEGFVEKHENRLVEDIAEEYYYELISRNFLLPFPGSFEKTACKMHDLLRQLACHLSRGECFLGDLKSVEVDSVSKIRRVSVVTKEEEIHVSPNLDMQQFRVRTFVSFCSVMVDHSLFRRLSFVRVLNLTRTSSQNIPDSIGKLIHLRHLDLSYSKITCLPDSIYLLKNLQMLILGYCPSLHILPLTLTGLCNLRCLDLRATPINQVPKGIRGLKFLNDLQGFRIGGGSDNSSRIQDGWNLEELGPLLQLRTLSIITLERATPHSAEPLLIDKKYLRFLELRCTMGTDQPYSEENVCNIENVFEQLIPPNNLEKLVIEEFFGRRFSTWLSIATYFPVLRSLEFTHCESCEHLPPIGQLPNLKYLKISGANAVTKIGPEFVGCGVGNAGSGEALVAFPNLEYLVIEVMLNWEEWTFVVEEDEAEAEAAHKEGEGGDANKKGDGPAPITMRLLPRLKHLDLWGCPMLRGLPPQLGLEATSLKQLQLWGTPSLEVVENLPHLSDLLDIWDCRGLQRVSNVPQVQKLRVWGGCPNLRCVDKLDNLRQLFLHPSMGEVWLSVLQEQHRKQHGEDLDVYYTQWMV